MSVCLGIFFYKKEHSKNFVKYDQDKEILGNYSVKCQRKLDYIIEMLDILIFEILQR